MSLSGDYAPGESMDITQRDVALSVAGKYVSKVAAPPAAVIEPSSIAFRGCERFFPTEIVLNTLWMSLMNWYY